jgi:exosome complex RNA-binding protein Csl4
MSSSEYYCVPGDRLCASDRAISGSGTYEKQNFIYASIAGSIQLATTDQTFTTEKKPTLSVVRQDRTLAVPSVGSLAYCKVTSVTSRFVRCLIFAINNQPLKTRCHGRINRDNIESINKDSVVCSSKFRPDDIVLARSYSIMFFICLHRYHAI